MHAAQRIGRVVVSAGRSSAVAQQDFFSDMLCSCSQGYISINAVIRGSMLRRTASCGVAPARESECTASPQILHVVLSVGSC